MTLAFTCPHLSSSSANLLNMPFMKNIIPMLDRDLPFHQDIFVFILLQQEHLSGVQLHVYLSCTFCVSNLNVLPKLDLQSFPIICIFEYFRNKSTFLFHDTLNIMPSFF
jgi:hypothetical protein